MLHIEISLPDLCDNKTRVFDVCPKFEDVTVYVRIKLCATCEKPFIPVQAHHRFCFNPACKNDFHNLKRRSFQQNAEIRVK